MNIIPVFETNITHQQFKSCAQDLIGFLRSVSSVIAMIHRKVRFPITLATLAVLVLCSTVDIAIIVPAQPIISVMTVAEKVEMLNAHNEARRNVPAADMTMLYWDEQVW